MTILVLEDNLLDQAVIRRALSGTEHTVLEALNLDDALEQLTGRHIDRADCGFAFEAPRLQISTPPTEQDHDASALNRD